MLVLCEGIEVYPRGGETWNSPSTDPDHPVNLVAHQDQLVYPPHDYRPPVFDQPWFQKPFT